MKFTTLRICKSRIWQQATPISLNEEIAIIIANALVRNKTLYKLDVGDIKATKDVADDGDNGRACPLLHGRENGACG
jgi:hypothetical protein